MRHRAPLTMGWEEYVETVLDVVERIPPGRVLSYGAIAELVGQGGPRQVARVMSSGGGPVPWWRVVRADGRPAPCHDGEAAALLRAEGTPFRRDGARLDMCAAAWDGADAPGA